MRALAFLGPALVPAGQSVDTIAAPAVLAVFNWSKGNDRYRRIERFVERLFSNWDQFREPPRHPKWRDVNLAMAHASKGCRGSASRWERVFCLLEG